MPPFRRNSAKLFFGNPPPMGTDQEVTADAATSAAMSAVPAAATTPGEAPPKRPNAVIPIDIPPAYLEMVTNKANHGDIMLPVTFYAADDPEMLRGRSAEIKASWHRVNESTVEVTGALQKGDDTGRVRETITYDMEGLRITTEQTQNTWQRARIEDPATGNLILPDGSKAKAVLDSSALAPAVITANVQRNFDIHGALLSHNLQERILSEANKLDLLTSIQETYADHKLRDRTESSNRISSSSKLPSSETSATYASYDGGVLLTSTNQTAGQMGSYSETFSNTINSLGDGTYRHLSSTKVTDTAASGDDAVIENRTSETVTSDASGAHVISGQDTDFTVSPPKTNVFKSPVKGAVSGAVGPQSKVTAPPREPAARRSVMTPA